MALPQFPTEGPLRPLAIGATVGIVGFVVALIASLVRRRREQALWTAAVVVLAAATVPLGMWNTRAHDAAAVVTVALALRNVVALRGLARHATGIGALGWLVALVAARMLFGAAG